MVPPVPEEGPEKVFPVTAIAEGIASMMPVQVEGRSPDQFPAKVLPKHPLWEQSRSIVLLPAWRCSNVLEMKLHPWQPDAEPASMYLLTICPAMLSNTLL